MKAQLNIGQERSFIDWLLSVDGKLYKFLGEPARELKAILPIADLNLTIVNSLKQT
jgi:hypothetical protein